ncbi:MAG: hypothetical protein ABI921_06965 [Panacibacter sp.]
MIKNEKQYKISRKRLNDIVEKIDDLKNKAKDNTLKSQMMQASLENFKKDIEAEINEYETLKNGKSATLKERSIADLPSMIIEYKIAHHLTHKEFSTLLGIKEQQLQRYEAESFQKVSFQNLIKFISFLDMDLKVKETVIKPKRKLRTASSKATAKV